MFILLLISFLFLPKSILAVDSSVVTISDFSSDSDPEWVQLTNNTDQDINLTNWALRDENDEGDDKDSIILDICISPNSFEIITNNTHWLNNAGDAIYLYNSEKELVNSLSYSPGNDKSPPESNNTCVIPEPTPIPTLVPTTDSTVTNPDSGINLTEFMPYSAIEWIEIYNQNNFDVKLVGWEIRDNGSNIKSINPDLFIKANSFAIFEFSRFLNNDQGDKVALYNQNQNIVDSHFYENGYYSPERSWSKVNGSWCPTISSQNKINNSCFIFPDPINTPIPTPTNTPAPTPTPDLNRYQAPTGFTPSVIMAPTSKENTPTPISNPTLTPSSEGMVLGIDDNQPPKKNFLPMIIIVLGGILLITPVIITKIKK